MHFVQIPDSYKNNKLLLYPSLAILMKFSSFASTLLLTTACLAADDTGKIVSSDEQVQPFDIQTCAIAIGLALGASKDFVIKDLSDEKNISLLVSTNKLEEAIMVNSKWKGEDRISDPLATLFNRQCLLHSLNNRQRFLDTLEVTPRTEIIFRHFQLIFMECASVPEAKYAVDVAILNWLSEEIQNGKSDATRMVEVEPLILGSICALGLDQHYGKQFTNAILAVLTQVQQLIVRDCNSQCFPLEIYFPTIFMVVKLFDDGPIRNKAMEIATARYKADIQEAVPIFNFCFGGDHPFVKSIETTLLDEEEQARRKSLLDLQDAFARKVHSLAIMPSLNPIGYFMFTTECPCLRADIITGGTVEWESRQVFILEAIDLHNKRSVMGGETQLLIIFQMKPPANLCMEITSCASMSIFYELLEKPLMKQMILSYGMTILETN